MRRVLLFVDPLLPSALVSKLQSLFSLLIYLGGLGITLFRLNRNGPQKTKQFPSQRRHDLVLVFAACRKGLVAFVQPLLRLPCDLLGLLGNRQILLASQQKARHIRTMLISPSRFHQHPSQMTVACLSDGTALYPASAGVFAGHQAAISHQLPRTLEAREGSDFGDDRRCRDLRHSAQR